MIPIGRVKEFELDPSWGKCEQKLRLEVLCLTRPTVLFPGRGFIERGLLQKMKAVLLSLFPPWECPSDYLSSEFLDGASRGRASPDYWSDLFIL